MCSQNGTHSYIGDLPYLFPGDVLILKKGKMNILRIPCLSYDVPSCNKATPEVVLSNKLDTEKRMGS